MAAAAIAGGVVYALTRPAPSAVPAGLPAADRVEPGPAAPGGEIAAPAETMPEAPMRERAATPEWEPPAQTVAPRTRPAAVPTASIAPPPRPVEPVLVLHAISEQDGVPIAVINDRVVREGQTFDGVRVLRIGPVEVEVEVAGAKRIVRFR